MYPDPDSRADQFDDAFERRQAGEDQPTDDQDLQELLQLASRLERELPEDVPDPAFRNSLKQELLEGATSADHPVDLAGERWSRRLVASPWRLGAVAAAVLVVVVAGVAMAMTPMGDGDGDSSEMASFQEIDQDGTAQAGGTVDAMTGLEPANQRLISSSFPPFDHEHIVLPPLLTEFLSLDEHPGPEIDVNSVDGMMEDADMPETATVYYLSAPSSAETMLTTLRSTLGIEGEILPGSTAGEPYQVITPDDEPVITWDPGAAFFHFRGEFLDEPVTDLAGEDAEPDEIALAFLERIGFDLNTIRYEHQVTTDGGMNAVEFRPADFPEMGLAMSLGGRIMIDSEGVVQEARLYWMSLIETREATLRDPDEILRDIEGGDGYSPPMPDADEGDRMEMDVDDIKVAHVLTRLEEGSFILQPAVTLTGDYAGSEESSLPGPAEYVVPAVESEG